jgi:predicted dehydrogenase
MDKGYEILEEVDKAGVLSCVGYQLRLLDSTQRARHYLATHTVAMVTAHRWGGLPSAPWWKVMSQSGGQLHEQTTHQVDLMRYMAGEIVEVYAHYSRRVMDDIEGLDTPDSQGVLFKFLDGTIGMVATSPMMSQGGGVNELRFLVADHVLTWTAGGNLLDPDDDPEVTATPVDTPNIDAAFVKAIRTGDVGYIPCSYRSGLQTSAVTLAANESARQGRPIEVPQI